LSLDANRDASDIRLGGQRAIPALGPGVTSTGTVTVTVPRNVSFGLYLLLACADDGGAVSETAETNNCLASTGSVQVGGGGAADLVTTAISNPPAVVAPGGTFFVTDTVENQGTGIAGPSTTGYFLSVTRPGTSLGLGIGNRSVGRLAAGESSTASVQVRVGPSIPLGTYYVVACADIRLAVNEALETNNCWTSETTVQVGLPDLALTFLTDPPPTTTRRGTFAVTDTVNNLGVIASAATRVAYFLSPFPIAGGPGGYALQGNREVPSLAPGAASTSTVQLTVVGFSTQPGTYFLLACVDPASRVGESDERNNCRISSTQIVVTP
jgi:subtilase family serine protease